MDLKTVLGSAAASAVVVAVGVPSMINFVSLQAGSPGVPDVGHSNVTGYSLASRFGAGASPSLARVQVKETGALQGVRAETESGVALFGKSLASSGLGAGGYFTTSSVGGRGIVGEALSPTGSPVGGLFYNYSNGGGAAVWGRAIGVSGTATGVVAETMSGNGTALSAVNRSSGNSLAAGTGNDSLKTVGKIPRHEYVTGTPAAMAPIAYGYVNGLGQIFNSTGNFTVVKVAAGIYEVDIANVVLAPPDFVCIATAVQTNGDQFATVGSPLSGDFRITVYDVSDGALAESDVMFVVYRANGFSAMDPARGRSELDTPARPQGKKVTGRGRRP